MPVNWIKYQDEMLIYSAWKHRAGAEQLKLLPNLALCAIQILPCKDLM